MGFHCYWFSRQTLVGSSLLRKIKGAISEKAIQSQAWEQLSSVLDPREVSVWLAEVEAWEDDNSHPNPFQSRSSSMLIIGHNGHYSPNFFFRFVSSRRSSQATQQDATELQIDGMSVPTDISPSAMIHMGLGLEELQLSRLSLSHNKIHSYLIVSDASFVWMINL